MYAFCAAKTVSKYYVGFQRIEVERIKYANTNKTNFNTNFSNLDVMIKGFYPNWSYSFLHLSYSC